MFVADTLGRSQYAFWDYAEDGAILNLGFKANTPFVEEFSMTNYDLYYFS